MNILCFFDAHARCVNVRNTLTRHESKNVNELIENASTTQNSLFRLPVVFWLRKKFSYFIYDNGKQVKPYTLCGRCGSRFCWCRCRRRRRSQHIGALAARTSQVLVARAHNDTIRTLTLTVSEATMMAMPMNLMLSSYPRMPVHSEWRTLVRLCRAYMEWFFSSHINLIRWTVILTVFLASFLFRGLLRYARSSRLPVHWRRYCSSLSLLLLPLNCGVPAKHIQFSLKCDERSNRHNRDDSIRWGLGRMSFVAQ